MALLAGACDLKRAPVLDPKGPIALAERDLLFDAFYVMMLVIVPIIILTLWFAWRYRASNTKAKYTPTWANSVTERTRTRTCRLPCPDSLARPRSVHVVTTPARSLPAVP